MTGLSGRQAAIRGFGWGAIAGLALVALMYLASLLRALRPLPQLLNQPLLAGMPGFVFGFLIDTLQHDGKVVEELGLIVAMVIGLGLLGSAWALASLRWHSQYLALGFAGVGWLFVTAILLQLGGDTGGADSVDAGRRRLLGTLPITIGAVSIGVLAFRLLPGWYQAIFNPPEAGLRGPSPEITPVDNFYYVSKNFSDPSINAQGWSLTVGGMVDRSMRLSLSDLKALPGASEYVTMECISNNVGGELMSTGSFTGVRLRDLLAMAGPKPQGTWVAFTARDGYTESLPMTLVQGAPEIIVAYELDGAPVSY